MAIAATKVTENVKVRDTSLAVYQGFQRITQNASQFTAAELTALQAKVDALKAALTAAGA